MSRKYLAFDIETAKEVPDDFTNWRAHRPLGICCAATLAGGSDQPQLWHGSADDGRPAPRMSKQDARRLVEHLLEMSARGYTVITWNGLGFDFDVLAEESGQFDKCRQLARGHVDMMFHALCQLGHPVALDAAAKGMGLAGKPMGMTGLHAPVMWANGKHQEVLDYVAQDVRITLTLAEACEKRRNLNWISRAGVPKKMPLPNGWLTVAQSLALPLPDTSWMTHPPRREDYTSWLNQ